MRPERKHGHLPPWDVTLLAIFVAVLAYTSLLSELRHPQGFSHVIGTTQAAVSLPAARGHYDFYRDQPPLGSPLELQVRELRVPILMYHHVGDLPPGADAIRRGLTVSRDDFAAQLGWLANHGYHSVTLRDLYLALTYGNPLPDKPVVLTFDDGYRDNFTVALPLLHEHGFRGTFFIISGMVGRDDYMTWKQIAQARAEGVEIGSHSVDHADLAKLRGGQLDRELVEAKRTLAATLSVPVDFFCYPAGKYDATTIERARAAGYLMAVTTHPGTTHRSDHLFELTRVRVSGGEPLAKFVEAVSRP